MNKTAILFGSTGFVGTELLNLILENDHYCQIIVIVRHEISIQHNKLKVIKGDYNSIELFKEHLIGDDIFICLGSTKKKTPDLAEYYQVDFEYPLLAAKLCKEQGAKSISLVSAIGANSNSSIFYSKTKGQLEEAIIKLQYHHTLIYRPSLILGNRTENRSTERLLIKIWPWFNFILRGSLEKYRGIEAKKIAKAMFSGCLNPKEKVQIYYWRAMQS